MLLSAIECIVRKITLTDKIMTDITKNVRARM